MAHPQTATPSRETVEKAWHGWQTFVRFATISIVVTAIATAIVIAIITR